MKSTKVTLRRRNGISYRIEKIQGHPTAEIQLRASTGYLRGQVRAGDYLDELAIERLGYVADLTILAPKG